MKILATPNPKILKGRCGTAAALSFIVALQRFATQRNQAEGLDRPASIA